MNTADMSKELASLLRSLRADYPQAAPAVAAAASIECDQPLLCLLVRSYLTWESTSTKAATALKRLEAAVVDFNELRICMPDEVVRAIGERYPRAEERALRLRCTLNDLFRREHRVTLEHLSSLTKREAREYLESLEGLPRYVAARVELLGLGSHAAPVDSRIYRRLLEGRVIDADTPLADASGQLERKVRAGDLPEVYALLQAWADDANFTVADSWADGEPFSLRSAWSTRRAPAPNGVSGVVPLAPPVSAPRPAPALAPRDPKRKS